MINTSNSLLIPIITHIIIIDLRCKTRYLINLTLKIGRMDLVDDQQIPTLLFGLKKWSNYKIGRCGFGGYQNNQIIC
jgi:hypothetical protein